MWSISSKIKKNKKTLEVNLAFKIIRSFKCSIDVGIFCNLILEGGFFGDLSHVYRKLRKSLRCAQGGVEVV